MSRLETQRESVRVSRCIGCGYELPVQGGTTACPECGEVAPDDERFRLQLETVSFGCGLMVAGLALAACSWAEANGSLLNFSQGSSLGFGGQRLLTFASAMLISFGCFSLSGLRRGEGAGVVSIRIVSGLFLTVSAVRFGAGWNEDGLWPLFHGYFVNRPSNATALLLWCGTVLALSYCIFLCTAVSARVVGLSRLGWRSAAWALPATIVVGIWLLFSGVELFVSSLEGYPVRQNWWLNNVQGPLQRAAPTITILLLTGAVIVLTSCWREARSRLRWSR